MRLAEILCAQGYIVTPEDLRPQSGAWRTDVRLDVCRWEATLKEATGRVWLVQCRDTMSDCVRYGVAIEPDSRNGCYLNVSANSHSVPSPASGAPSSPGTAAANAGGIRRATTEDQNR